MGVPLRTTGQVQTDLARKIREAGRMTVLTPGYAEVHEEINRLLDELDMLDRA